MQLKALAETAAVDAEAAEEYRLRRGRELQLLSVHGGQIGERRLGGGLDEIHQH